MQAGHVDGTDTSKAGGKGIQDVEQLVIQIVDIEEILHMNVFRQE
jgi:hypothetical protein